MIHARKDGTISTKEPKTEDQGATPTQRVTTVRTVHALDPRRATFVTSSVGGTQAAVILSEAGSLPEGGTLQYRRVSIGPQLQHVVTPVQVQGSSSSDNQITTNPRCTVASAQDFAHILVASSSNSALHAVELQNSLVNVSASMPQQFQALGTISSGQRTTSGAVIAQPVSQAATMAPRIVLNSAGNAQDVYALRITAPTTLGGAQSQQIMVLDSSASLAPSTDVTKVHSYSLPSVATSSAGTMQKIVISAPGQPLQIASLQHKAPASLRAGIKRQLVTTTPIRTNVLTVNNADVMSHLSNVNKLLFGSMQYNGKASSIPSSPKPKRIKLEKTSVVNRDPAKRKRLLDHLSKKLQFLKIKYYQQQTEYFFLKNGGNLVDYITWRKKLPNTLLEYLKGNRFEPHDDAKVISEILSQSTAQSIGNPVLFSQVESSTKSIASSSHGVFRPSVPARPSAISPKKQIKHISKHNSLSSVYDSQIGSQEEIVERAKQEAYVMQRVSDLRKEGLWSLKRLPKVAESPRIKAHWDYLLEEMVWLATDFAQERKWKKAAAKKCARMITKYFQDKDMKAEKAEKEEQMRLKKIAGIMSREIKQFWNDIEKLAEHKQKVWLEEKRKKVLDVHLNFIVDQTEKYSSWLTQGLNQSTPTKQDPDSSGSDVDEEVRLLQQESEMPFEDFLHSLPPEVLCPEKREPKENSDDDDFKMSESEEDDEGTLLEQEKEEKNVDHKEEIRELEAENEMSVDELRNKYSAAYASDFEMDTSEQMNDEKEDSSSSSSDEFSEEEEDKSDLKTLAAQDDDKSSDKNPSKDISDIAATAESFQPKGNTLSTTQVCTIVPFLLKHSLREYQHIGLDWLNAMYEKKLNGILADEMGLGKTIQTISVLAHLACEKGMWGPHLIVVPTSVMLNWEMELKKWCPAFKILTYYGTPKERKQKRVGWTKPNAFHVCITSYKLVVQDHQSFRRKRWQYLILDEAHHIKNFKSQRWQLLLNFQSSHRLLLTGTPLQNNLMELWSLMHFLMPNVFSSHKEFKEWFGVIEGGNDYNEGLIKRLHKVLRPFLLRRLKSEVEKQLPKKYEHVVMCRLSKRQRYLYDDFMSQTKTKETLATGNFMSVINILMQLRKVCNHPNMFEERPTVSPFLMEGIKFQTASLAYRALEYNPFKQNSLQSLNLLLSDLELSLTAFAAHRVKKFQVPPKLIVEIDTAPQPPPSCPSVKMRVNFCNSQGSSNPSPATTLARIPPTVTRLPSGAPNRLSATVQPQRLMVIPGQPRISSPITSSQSEQQYTLQLVSPGTTSLGGLTLQLQPNRLGIQSLIGGRFVQTPTGQHFVIATIPNAEQPDASNTASSPTQKPITTAVTSAFLSNLNRSVNTSPITPASHNRPVGRVAPFNGHPSATPAAEDTTVNQNHIQPAKPPVVHSLTKPTPKPEPPPAQKTNSLFYLEPLIAARERERKNSLHLLAKINNCRCAACPIYGTDLVEAVSIMHCLRHPRTGDPWKGKGYVNCLNAIPSRENISYYWDSTKTLSSLIKMPEERVGDLLDIVNKFVFAIPAVTCPPIDLHVSHPSPSQWNEEQTREKRMGKYLAPKSAFLHPIVSNMKTQFPELRLIQYDCGKLQRLAHLLWELKSNHHRVLIFTQMTRMLDILEQFLNYHGHTYLRLDGNTKVEQRQALMERFNADKRVFCFILSTRSGGIGVNLTGADTVIFYDSDWNPTMDAQAQDRCHRIGQTRDVHIYRLISERTIEENILRKANQKRILGNLAIEGGNFTTAFFKTNTLHELFGIEVTTSPPKKIEEIPENTEEISQKDLEQALGKVEEESDHKAAQTASAEAVAEFAEFDESIPLDADSRDNEEKSQAEEELEKLIDKLSPIEKYALHFLESLQEPVGLEQLKLAEEEMEAQKKDWELGHLKALKEEEERRHQDSDDSPLFCGREASHQVFFSVNGQEEMPTWAPPTPPTHENDIYIDHTVGFWYESNVMHEGRLPPIYIKKEAKRQKLDPILPLNRKQKVRKEEMVSIPRSLFDRPSAALLKMRREVKMQKVKGMIGVKPLFNIKPPMLLNKPLVDTTHHRDRPEWIVQEDWAVLQVVQELQGVPLNLTVLLPAHTPNWDMASDGVHLISKHHRASKSCRIRYENVLVPREEGKILYDTNPKKQKKTKGIYKTKNNRPMKTSQLFVADNNTAYSGLTTDRQKMVSEAVARRKSKERPIFPQPPKSNKPAAVLVENSIHYDSPLTPLQIASARAERINREKNKTQPPLVVAQAVQASSVPTTVQSTELPRVTATALIPHQTVIASFAQAQQLQQVNLGKSTIQTGTLTSVSLAKSLASGIMVNTNTATAGTLANLTKALTQGGLTTQGATVSSAALAAALSTARVTTQVVATSTTQVQSPAVVSVGTVQLRPSTTVVPAPTVAVSQLTTAAAASNPSRSMAQLQALRQTAILRHREQQTLKQQHLKRLQQTTGQPVTKMAIGTQPRQQVAMKQTAVAGRPITESEMAQLMKRQQQQKQAQLTTAQILAQAQLQPQQLATATLVKTVSAPASSLAIPVTMASVNINVSVPQGKAGAVQAKGTLINQQLRQFQLQQQLLNQARKGNKVATNLAQLAKVPGKAGATSLNTVQIVQHSPQVAGTKGLPTAMTVQQIQQAMKQAIPQNLPVVVTATPSLSGIQPQQPGLKAQTTTLPSTTLTTSGMLKQQQTTTLLQSAPVTLAVRPQQLQIQVATSATATTLPTVSTTAQVVQAAIQAARQQQAAAAAGKASPYTMRLRNPPK